LLSVIIIELTLLFLSRHPCRFITALP